MLPSLEDVRIEATPVYIHKIDRQTHWNPAEKISLEDRVQRVVKEIFKTPDHTYSFWLVETLSDFYHVAASINALRRSPSDEIPSIWVKPAELSQIGLQANRTEEGKCLYAKNCITILRSLLTTPRNYASC
jgi:hypothetical protein